MGECPRSDPKVFPLCGCAVSTNVGFVVKVTHSRLVRNWAEFGRNLTLKRTNSHDVEVGYSNWIVSGNGEAYDSISSILASSACGTEREDSLPGKKEWWSVVLNRVIGIELYSSPRHRSERETSTLRIALKCHAPQCTHSLRNGPPIGTSTLPFSLPRRFDM